MEATSVLMRGVRSGAGMVRMLVGVACLAAGAAHAVTINVVDPQTKAAPAGTFGFRYTIQEDPTFDVVPDVTGLNGDPTLSLAFHRSHSKVVKVGHVAGASFEFTPPDVTKRYFVTVMPDNAGFADPTPTGFTMNGTSIRPGASAVSVPVNKLPFKTAQISVYVFEDNGPINGAADAPGVQENSLCGWEVQLFEAGGTYGASGGRVATDTFGNLLGTEYGPGGTDTIVKQGSNQLWTDRNGVVRIKNLSPAKYTIYSIAPAKMPSAARCNFADANGNSTNVPIWIATEAQRTRPDQMVWDQSMKTVGNSSYPYEVAPPALDADRTKWHQTTTIEGTWGVDSWVKAGEPTFFKEFGPPGHHVWHGFVRRFKDRTPTGLVGNGSVTGKVVSSHMSRPPVMRFYSGAPMTACWIGINSVGTGVGLGQALYADACNSDGTFTVTGLVPGQRYQLAVWDEPLDNVIANYEFVATAGALDLHDVPVFSWFSNVQGKVFYDKEGTGFPYDAAGNAKPGIPGSVVNIRFRDGSIYNSTVTDDEGKYEFAEVFPFFNWMVAETDFTRFKATGATIISDNGGQVVDPPLNMPDLWPAGTLAPQAQPENADKPYRIFGFATPAGVPTGDGSGLPNPSSANLLQNFQGFLGQTNVIHWGKSEYSPADPNDHGGITGVVHYASTRSEFDPKFATAENNEPGIPSVEIRLYKLNNQNMVLSPTRGVIPPSAADERDAVQVVVSDNFDKSQPENCVDPVPYTDRAGNNFGTLAGRSKCYDGMRIWNQVRDGVFDGGWAFVDRCPNGTRVVVGRDAAGEYTGTSCSPAAGGAPVDPVGLEPGRYMTEGVAPYGFEHQKEEDKNVDFGDLLVPGTLANPAECIGSRDEALDDNGNPYAAVGTPNLVPQFLTLFDGVEIPERFRDTATSRRPYCNKKLVVVAPGMNPFSDFHMFTKAPVAGHIVGMILDDLANEFDPYAPSFGEKYAPPFMPISIRDYAGNEINRVFSDRYGTYNALVPSTFAYNVPLPSGVAPNMVNVCLNSPTMKDPLTGATVVDPHYNPQYTQYCYTFQYLPGKTTYLDTPVLPIAAFAGPSQYALDVEQPDGTPGIKLVTGTNLAGNDVGPWVPAAGGPIRIVSTGMTKVHNPAYDQNDLGTPGVNAAPKTIDRNYGFGPQAGAKVLIGGTDVTASVSSWTIGVGGASDVLTVNVPAGVSGTVEVVHSNGRKSVRGVTLHAGGNAPRTVVQGQSIQAAIDAAGEGELITVGPGVYEEAPIVWKRVRVQGYGAPVTVVNAAMGADYLRQQAWREKACDLVLNQGMSAALLPGQTVPANMNACLTGDTVDNAPLLFAAEEASGFFVLQRPVGGANAAARKDLAALQIDGFTVTGADTGGGIVVNGNAAQMQISNNRITGNQGLYNGGIRIGHGDLAQADLPVNANNLFVNIHHNEILKNGNTAGEVIGGGGGISIYTGARGYRVANNYIAGNFSTGDGGGMAHFGASGSVSINVDKANTSRFIDPDNRTIADVTVNAVVLDRLTFASTISDNQFRFNQSFSQAKSVQGGGLAVVGFIDPVANNGLTLGTGDLTIINNTFQGNLAGAGDGGGIALVGVNGTEIRPNLNAWNRVDILNNVIVNNGAGVAGGGISLQDAANVNIVNNTIAMNDSYATAARAFQGANSPTQANNCALGLGGLACSPISRSTAQNGAGIASYAHSPGLLALARALGAGGPNNPAPVPANKKLFSDAAITNTVVIGNRRYHWEIDYTVNPLGSTTTTPCTYAMNGQNDCFGLRPEAQTASGNDIAVLFAAGTLRPTYSVFSYPNAGDGTNAATNNQGDATVPGTDFTSAYLNGTGAALKQLIYALEQSVVIGAPVLEVQEPTVATTAAAFDEGGNFIDVRFGPLTRGSCQTLATWTASSCSATSVWTDFGTYNPISAAATTPTRFGSGLDVSTTWPKLTTDRNGIPRSASNWVRGALAQ